MALVTRRADVSIDPSMAHEVTRIPNLTGLVAGQALDPGAPCHIHTDGTVHMSNGTAADADAVVHGFTGKSYVAGEPVTLYRNGAVFEYTALGTLTPGATLYLGATDGRLDTAATTGDAAGVAIALDDSHIMVAFTKG